MRLYITGHVRLYITGHVRLYITHSHAERLLSLCQSIHFSTELPYVPDQQEQLANDDWQYGQDTDDQLEERKKKIETMEKG